MCGRKRAKRMYCSIDVDREADGNVDRVVVGDGDWDGDGDEDGERDGMGTG